MFRRFLGWIFALALTVGGAYLFIVMVFFVWMPAKLILIFAAAAVSFSGLYWLWSDFMRADDRLEN